MYFIQSDLATYIPMDKCTCSVSCFVHRRNAIPEQSPSQFLVHYPLFKLIQCTEDTPKSQPMCIQTESSKVLELNLHHNFASFSPRVRELGIRCWILFKIVTKMFLMVFAFSWNQCTSFK